MIYDVSDCKFLKKENLGANQFYTSFNISFLIIDMSYFSNLWGIYNVSGCEFLKKIKIRSIFSSTPFLIGILKLMMQPCRWLWIFEKKKRKEMSLCESQLLGN